VLAQANSNGTQQWFSGTGADPAVAEQGTEGTCIVNDAAAGTVYIGGSTSVRSGNTASLDLTVWRLAGATGERASSWHGGSSGNDRVWAIGQDSRSGDILLGGGTTGVLASGSSNAQAQLQFFLVRVRKAASKGDSYANATVWTVQVSVPQPALTRMCVVGACLMQGVDLTHDLTVLRQ
jgi:hypothetical protein